MITICFVMRAKYEPFCSYFLYLIQSKGFDQLGLAKKAKLGRGLIQSMAIGRTRPPLSKIPVIADALDLSGMQREEFTRLAQLAHVPSGIREKLLENERRLDAFRQRYGALIERHIAVVRMARHLIEECKKRGFNVPETDLKILEADFEALSLGA